jgi:hypothetical protein
MIVYGWGTSAVAGFCDRLLELLVVQNVLKMTQKL